MEKIWLCGWADIEDGDCRGFDPFDEGRDRLFVVRQGNRAFAWRNACPHRGYEGSTMAWRKHAYLNAGRNRIVCSSHGAQFDIETGECLAGPCPGQALEPATVHRDEFSQLYWLTNRMQEK
ncbi:Rieske 2Fe-2S domain-containing protein [Aestuariicella hydrocarbonica]|uniref:Rieske 2Fe-2S domain-containing protein n=1 Tax=Pseudomaricurvus hydrocarbonicus TaxID=1470433 RepID=A0A9E5JU48_9GAMM|nr:Rieske 2Fe-2S domain-containing protein [Aestuariicella hydrocarbonica]NHO66882.1 Rieske 2Fe-2S domain-containing protein [Aestuariicella hydrocarbonica]